MGKSMEKTQICTSEGNHPKMCACLLKLEFCHPLSNVSFLILTSTGSLIPAFCASLSMERAPNRRLWFLGYEAFNQPVQHRSVTVVKMHGTCKPTSGLDIMEETLEQPCKKYQLHKFWRSQACRTTLLVYAYVFFKISQDLIYSTPHPKSIDCLEVVCFVSVVCRCVTFIEVSAGYSLHSSYFLVLLQNSQKPTTFK